ncbi:MAG: hypothetical protein RMY29_020195 [Nostoc sp. CreGUA01]|nr:hypothetical protein [Nostoc sp. CreGUA01]
MSDKLKLTAKDAKDAKEEGAIVGCKFTLELLEEGNSIVYYRR